MNASGGKNIQFGAQEFSLISNIPRSIAASLNGCSSRTALEAAVCPSLSFLSGLIPARRSARMISSCCALISGMAVISTCCLSSCGPKTKLLWTPSMAVSRRDCVRVGRRPVSCNKRLLSCNRGLRNRERYCSMYI